MPSDAVAGEAVVGAPAARPGNKPGPKPRPSRDAIVDAAVEMGVEHLTIGAVAAALGVTSGSLYRYVDGLDDLAAAAVEQVFARAPLPEPGVGWRAFLEAEAGIRWTLLMRYGGLVGENGADLTAVATSRFEELTRTLTGKGFTLAEAVRVLDAVLDMVHDGATQVLSSRDPDGGINAATTARLERYSPDIRAEIAGMLDDPWPHVSGKLALLLDGIEAARRH